MDLYFEINFLGYHISTLLVRRHLSYHGSTLCMRPVLQFSSYFWLFLQEMINVGCQLVGQSKLDPLRDFFYS